MLTIRIIGQLLGYDLSYKQSRQAISNLQTKRVPLNHKITAALLTVM